MKGVEVTRPCAQCPWPSTCDMHDEQMWRDEANKMEELGGVAILQRIWGRMRM